MQFTNVRVPAEALLGTEGDAFAKFSLPMRKVEHAGARPPPIERFQQSDFHVPVQS